MKVIRCRILQPKQYYRLSISACRRDGGSSLPWWSYIIPPQVAIVRHPKQVAERKMTRKKKKKTAVPCERRFPMPYPWPNTLINPILAVPLLRRDWHARLPSSAEKPHLATPVSLRPSQERELTGHDKQGHHNVNKRA